MKMEKAEKQREIRKNLMEQLSWEIAERDDSKVAEMLYSRKEADAVHTLDEAGMLDEFFEFLRTSGVMSLWKRYEISAIQRVFVPTICFLLLYGSRILLGIESMNALPALLFSNIAVMTLIGFNGYAVKEGMTKRGESQRTGERDYALMDPQTLAENICKSSVKELEGLFNGNNQLPSKIWYIYGRDNGSDRRKPSDNAREIRRKRLLKSDKVENDTYRCKSGSD